MDINRILEENPSRKARASQEAEDYRLEWQESKTDYDLWEAKQALIFKAEDESLTATAIKQKVLSDEVLYAKRLGLLMLESKYRRKEVEVKSLDDEITSAKMVAKLKMQEMQNLNWGGK